MSPLAQYYRMSSEALDQMGHPDWLFDIPLFMNQSKIEHLYDIIVRPFINKESITGTRVQASSLFDRKMNTQAAITFGPKDTISDESSYPQRKFLQILLSYEANFPERVFNGLTTADGSWHGEGKISQLPRGLVFLDLPGIESNQNENVPDTTMIPTAAGFEDSETERLFEVIQEEVDGDSPEYGPEQEANREYWNWFVEKFYSLKFIEIIEDASEDHGRLQWIDFRLPITDEGDTVHLHFSPAGNYETSTFAYSLVRRGHKHGLRIIGTLNSAPDMTVLAAYNK